MSVPSAASIQRTYLVLMLGNTLAASFIWGINTIFLLDAGLSNLEAFAANAFFTAGMVLFEVPTGIVADGVGRRTSYLLGTVTLTRHDAAVRAAVVDRRRRSGRGRSRRWGSASGFTFFSGAVEAWLVDALTATGSTARWRTVFGRGQIVGGVAMLIGSVAGGFLAPQVSLGTPFVVRGAVLAVMFVVAFGSCTTSASPRPRRATGRCARCAGIVDRVDRLRLARARREVADGAGAVHRRRRHLRLLRAAAVPARALRRPAAPTRSPGSSAAIVAGAQILGGLARRTHPRAASRAARRRCC